MSTKDEVRQHYEATHTDNTDASTFGALPYSVCAVLLALACIGVLGIGTTLGYRSTTLAVLFAAGLLAAFGVRVATTQRVLAVPAGVTLLWIAAITFTITTVLLITQSANAVGGILVPLTIAAAALLTAFGILGSTLQSFGHGAARTVLSRYLLGTIFLVAASTVLLISTPATDIAWTTIMTILPTFTDGTIANMAVYSRAVLGVVFYTVLISLGHRTAYKLPFEVLVPAHDFNRLTAARRTVTRIRRYAFAGIAGYTIAVGSSAVLAESGGGTLHSIAYAITQVGAATPLLTIAALGSILLAGALLVTWGTRNAPGVTGPQLLETITPPLTILGVTVLLSNIAGDRIAAYLMANSPGSGIEPGGVLHQVVTGQPSIIVLVLLTAALLVGAVVLALPSILAWTAFGDTSLAGIAAAVIGLGLVVVIAVLARASPGVIVGGTVLTAIIWEMGEYTTVAVGELRAHTPDEPLPDNFATLTAIHGVGITVVGVVALLVAMVALFLFGTVSVTPTTAVVSLIFSSFALVVLVKLIPG